MTIVGHNLDLLQHLGFSCNNATAVTVLQKRWGKGKALTGVVKLVHVTSSKVFWSKVIVKMYAENVY